MRTMRVLYVAYPLLTVSEESAGGAEQVLWTLEREMAARGIATSVAASDGSRVSGELLATGMPCSLPDDFERRNREHQERIVELVRDRARGEHFGFDLVHDMSGSFWTRAREIDKPLLGTLHLPRHFYSSVLFAEHAPGVSFNCVSRSQARSFSDIAIEAVAPNGIALDLFSPPIGRPARTGLLWLGRICEEKAPHLAIEIASCTGMPITVAGQVYPFSYHRQYFDREIAPRIKTPGISFVNSPSATEKRRLLSQAQAVLITSQVDETSSLVAMEAAASGTPVIAFHRGALPEIVQQGVTGWLVGGVEEAADAVSRIGEIDSAACVSHARLHFSAAAMADRYTSLYRRILGKAHGQVSPLQDDKSSFQAV